MKLKKWIDGLGTAALKFDGRTQELFKPHADGEAVAALHPISKLGDQPQLRTLLAA